MRDPPDEAEQAQLLERAGSGDPVAVGELLARHRDAVRRYVERRMDPRLRARVDPSDVVQEAQLEAAQRLDDFLRRRPMPFHIWLCRTAHQQMLRLRRQHVEAGCRALRDGYHFYTEAKGMRTLREAVAEDCLARRGVAVDPNQVMIVPGGKPTLFFAVLMFGERGTEILYPNPGFPIYESMIAFSGATPVPIELREERGFELDPDEVLSKINERTRLLILNTPANPTGGVIGKAALDRLAAGLERHPHVAILADEIYSRLVYAPAQHHSMLAYESLRERTILLDGWSKTFSMTGWRLGWGLWPKEWIQHAERLQILDLAQAVRRSHEARADSVAADVAVAEFDSDGAGEHMHRALGRVVEHFHRRCRHR